jgi:chemotaxis protein MotB
MRTPRTKEEAMSASRLTLANPRAMLVFCLLASGCVTTSAYNAKVAELESQSALADKAAAMRAKAAADREAALQANVKQLEARARDLDTRVAQLTSERDALRKGLDDNTALVSELKKRLEKLGQNVDKLTSERGQLSGALDDAKQRLEELRKQKAAAEALASTFRKLIDTFRSMIDAGKLKVVIRDGRMLIALPNDVLFDIGKTAVKPEAQAALGEVATVLATIPDRKFLVAGHTDNVPIHTERFPSNWELSTARAVEVTRYLVAHGMQPQNLAAAGYGEFDPVAPNETPESRALNRRIEIVLQPNLGELPSVEGLMPAPHAGP